MKKNLRAIIFTLAGAFVGYLYYRFYGCMTGCFIASDPIRTMVYMAIVGYLLHSATKKGLKGE
ncbi:MAG: hypothetical protein SPH32_05550 [Erysipelotrichaceae bacterium]|nr:hypothetical protein [Erysipelotrichaceae bacterium]